MANTSDASTEHVPSDSAQTADIGADLHDAPEGTLAAAIAGRGPHPLALPAPLPLVVALASQLAEQVEARHARGEAYGVLDPAHVLLRGTPGEPLRAELATPMDSTLSAEEATAGSDAFAISGFTAPERFEGELGIRGDQYALAALAYLLLTGEPPFAGTPAEQALEQLFAAPEPPRVLNPALPFAVSAVILRALAKRPEDRYPSVAAFAAALRHAAGTSPESAVPLPSWLRQTAAPSRPFVVTPRASVAAFASRVPPRGLSALEEPPPSFASGVSGEWRAAAPPPVIPPVPPQPPSRYPLLSPRARRIQIAAALALLLALLLGAGLAMAASGGRPRASAPPPIVQASSTSSPLPIVTLPPAPTSTPIPTPTPAPTHPPVPTPSGPIERASSGDAATAGAVVAPNSVAPGQRFTVTLTMVNSGRTTWSGGAGYTLACDTVRHLTSCISAFRAGLGGAVVPPGRSVTFTLTLTASRGPGTYTAWFSMARNGRLFPSSDAVVRVTVS